MRLWHWASASLLAVAAIVIAAEPPTDPSKDEPADGAGELLPPVRLEANGKPIDTAVGHAAPFVGDFYGTGNRDLLVGQFGEGILWVYKNVGTNAAPKFAAGVKFKEGTADGRVPTG
jgi:hypothetical protein